METTFIKTQQSVMQVLKWNEQDYADNVYNCGLAYLQYYIGDESMLIISQIQKSKTFWNWWKKHWEKRDENFLSVVNNCVGSYEWPEVYLELHDPRTLAEEIYPTGAVLGESYDNMMQELQKEVEHA